MKQFKSTFELLTAMFTIAVIASMPILGTQSAFAQNSPSVSSVPAPIIAGSTTNLLTITTAPDATKPHADVKVSFAEPTVIIGWPGAPGAPDVAAAPGGTCTLPSITANPSTRSYWIFRDAATGLVDVKFDVGAAPALVGMVSIPLAPGVVGVAYSGSASGPASGKWVDIVNGAPMAINFAPDLYSAGHCGYDNFGTLGATNSLYGTVSGIPSQKQVGGTIIPISTSALLIGGIASTGLWMIPVLGAAGFAVLTIRKKLL